jgi:mycothiol synthase
MRLRPATPDDAPAVLAVLAAREEADLGTVESTLAALREEWAAPGFDAVVADVCGIVGYAALRPHEAVAVVDPAHEGQGAGARLLEWAEARERACCRTRHRQWVGAANDRARALLTAVGYRPAGAWWRMARALDDAAAPAPPPAGIHLRPLDPTADAAAAYALNEAAFADNPEYEGESPGEFHAEHLQARDLAPDLSRMAERDGAPVGLMLVRRLEDGAGLIDILGVHPRERGRGLARALLGDVFAAFTDAGLREARLGVSADNTAALALYEGVGMRRRFRVDGYERPAGDGGRAPV